MVIAVLLPEGDFRTACRLGSSPAVCRLGESCLFVRQRQLHRSRQRTRARQTACMLWFITLRIRAAYVRNLYSNQPLTAILPWTNCRRSVREGNFRTCLGTGLMSDFGLNHRVYLGSEISAAPAACFGSRS